MKIPISFTFVEISTNSAKNSRWEWDPYQKEKKGQITIILPKEHDPEKATSVWRLYQKNKEEKSKQTNKIILPRKQVGMKLLS